MFKEIQDKVSLAIDRGMTRKSTFVLGIMFGVFLMMTFMAIERKGCPSFAYVDMDRVISKIAEELANQKVSNEELAAIVDSKKQDFQKELKKVSKENRLIIFTEPKPVEGANDITNHMINRLITKAAKDKVEPTKKIE